MSTSTARTENDTATGGGGHPDGVVVTAGRERRPARLRILESAREAAVTRGWERVRMGEVATAAGVSRPTLYREFGSKDAVGEALIGYEADMFFQGISAVLAQHRDVQTGLAAATVFTVDEAARNPLLRAVLTGARASRLLPFLTTRSELVLGGGRVLVADWVGRVEPGAPARAVDEAVDAVVRLVISHIVAPALAPSRVGERIGRLARAVLDSAGDRPRGERPAVSV